MVERLVRNEKASGSTPLSSTIFFSKPLENPVKSAALAAQRGVQEFPGAWRRRCRKYAGEQIKAMSSTMA